MITSIVFSKNRPLQLDLCLNSIKNNFTDCDQIYVLENYTDEYHPSLEQLKTDHSDVSFLKQSKSIYSDMVYLSDIAKNKYICLLTDDDIVYIKFRLAGYDSIFNEENKVCCISLRLGLNITERRHLQHIEKDTAKQYLENNNILYIPKTLYLYGSYWSYSHSLDGHIFTRYDINIMMSELALLDKHFHYKQTPNELEGKMQRFWTDSYNGIVCPKHSVVVNSPNNRVSETHNDNSSGQTHNYNASYLNELYLTGKRINLDKLDFSNIKCPHTEIDLIRGLYDSR